MSGSYTPQSSGDWKCAGCGLYQTGGQAIYLGGRGPLCLSCVPPMPKSPPAGAEEPVNLTETPDATIRRLAGECISLKGHLDSLANFLRERGEADPLNLPVGRAIGHIKRLVATNARLRGALEFYANEDFWKEPVVRGVLNTYRMEPPALGDAGDKARAALEGG